jgi:hypothetical protein
VKTNPDLASMQGAIGTWRTTGRHPYLPGRTLRGTATFAWIEDGAFIRMETHMEDPEVPDGVAVFGADQGACTMLYHDARGVSRVYGVELHADGFTWSRDGPDMAQRFQVTVAGDRMTGRGQMKKAGAAAWEGDLELDCERVAHQDREVHGQR